MTKIELLKKLDELETRAFLINMIDRWTWEDKQLLNKTEQEIKAIKEEIEKM